MKYQVVKLVLSFTLISIASCSDDDCEDGIDGVDGISCWDTNANGNADPDEDINQDGNFNALDCQGVDGASGQNGTSCWDTNSNGNADPDEDINQDGNFDALDCQGVNGQNGTSCWDTNNNGSADPDEDINQDGNFDALDCQGSLGSANVQRIDISLEGISGAEWEFTLDEAVLPVSDHLYLTFLRNSTSKIWYDVPGNLTIKNTNDAYCRRFIREDENGLGIRFHLMEDDTLLDIEDGKYDILILFAIRVDSNQNAKMTQQEVLNRLKSLGVDSTDFYQVTTHFGFN